MSLRLLIDEDSQAKRLVSLLRQGGHNVVTVNEAGLMGQSDPVVLNYASNNNRILLTFNCRDFQTLHRVRPEHSGILAVYRDADFSKDMSFKAIVGAIANLEAASFPLANQFVSVNQWNY